MAGRFTPRNRWCVDEKSMQLLKNSRTSVPTKPGASAKQDYEYERAGTYNLLVTVEPKAGHCTVEVTDRRTKTGFVAFARYLLEQIYRRAHRIHIVLDNLNTHFRECFEEVLGVPKTKRYYASSGMNDYLRSAPTFAPDVLHPGAVERGRATQSGRFILHPHIDSRFDHIDHCG
jgi:DDE superfamily endonuclease